MPLPTVHPSLQSCPFTDDELAWLWPKYRACGFSPATFAKRFARNEFSQLTDKGKVLAAKLAFQYRRQIFEKSEKWDADRFILAVKTAAAKP